LKKIIFLTFSTLALLSVGVVSYIPVFQINLLKQNYIKTTFNKDQGVSYAFSTEKPKNWIALNHIKKSAYSAIVVSEDWAFYDHQGVDYNQLQIAILESFQGKRMRGASTISQQVVKNIFTNGERSLSRKVKELLGTIVLEKFLTKEKILEVYLNVIQYGDGLYGIENASRHYFNKSASKLTTKEGAFLAMLLPSPVRYSQSFKDKELTDYAKTTINTILDKMAVAKYITKKEALSLKDEKLSFEKRNVIDDVFEYFNSL
jgi:monofunctional biosynthetic peptidoglycan transglycosylase